MDNMDNNEEFGYAGGKGTWLIVLLVLSMALLIIGYTTSYFFPDLSLWLEGGKPDSIIWQTEFQGK